MPVTVLEALYILSPILKTAPISTYSIAGETEARVLVLPEVSTLKVVKQPFEQVWQILYLCPSWFPQLLSEGAEES